MLHLEILAVDPTYAAALRGRLADRGHAVRVQAPRAEGRRARSPEAQERADLLLVATGHRPVVRTNVDDLARLALPAGRDGVAVPVVLCAAIDPTSDALLALHERGFDLVFGASNQRDIEGHIEALERLAQRFQRGPGAPPTPHRAAEDPALVAARQDDAATLRRAARHWWSLDSLDPPVLRRAVERLASTNEPVLVRGEAGSGRRHVARVLHEVARREGRFVQVPADRLQGDAGDLGARIHGWVDAARGGTLCLVNLCAVREDRARQLREALAERSHVRLVVTSPPEARPQLGLTFEGGAVVDVPRLAARTEALPALAQRLVGRELAPEALRALAHHPWTGNLAELEAVLRRAAERHPAGPVQLADLPPNFDAPAQPPAEPAKRTRRSWIPRPHEYQITDDDPLELVVYERKLLLRALAVAKGSRKRAAALVGLGKSTFYRKLRGELVPYAEDEAPDAKVRGINARRGSPAARTAED